MAGALGLGTREERPCVTASCGWIAAGNCGAEVWAGPGVIEVLRG